MLDILSKYSQAFLDGAFVTLSMTGIAWIIGILAGFIIGFTAAKKSGASRLLFFISTFIGSIPVIAILFWFHYPFQVSLGLILDPYWVSVFVFSIINVFLVADSVIHAASHTPKEYIDCSRIYGLSRKTQLLNIELPMVLRASIPAILKIQVSILHMTLFASLISVPELFRTAQQINSIENKVVEIYTLLALFYLMLSLPLIIAASALKKRFSFDLSER